MNSKERWLAVLQRKVPDRIPMDYWGTPEATEKVMAHLGVDDYWKMCERLHIDAVVAEVRGVVLALDAAHGDVHPLSGTVRGVVDGV